MRQTIRYIKIGMVASIALFFSIVAIDNIIDFNSNWLFVKHVLSMDTTHHDPALMGRAITNPLLQKVFYSLIIFWEAITAIFCWIGVIWMLIYVKAESPTFNESKKWAFIGLFLGFILYMVGFIVIAGEWFSMWQSTTWNGQVTAGMFVSLIMFVMLFLKDD